MKDYATMAQINIELTEDEAIKLQKLWNRKERLYTAQLGTFDSNVDREVHRIIWCEYQQAKQEYNEYSKEVALNHIDFFNIDWY